MPTAPLTYRASALGPLRAVEWTIPSGVSVLVGPNRVGKSTLLRVPELIKLAITVGLNEAVKQVFDGVSYLRNWSMPTNTPIRLGLTGIGGIEWDVELTIHGGEIAPFPSEQLRRDGALSSPLASAVFTRSYRTYHYEIPHLLRFGSAHSSDLTLRSNGENVFPLLRNWRDRPDLEQRYEFVLATMREIFPHLGRVGFEQAGQTVTMITSDRRWPDNSNIPIARESTGFVTALLQLCALASAEPGSLITFDEVETSLHPRAIRVLVEAMRRWSAKHDLRIVLATQSETVLDQFREDPSRVFVLEPKQERSPQALTELFSPEYLSQFSLGDLFAHLEFGADDPAEP
jgi:predicted ATPase